MGKIGSRNGQKCRFYLFCLLDYQMNYYEVELNRNKDYGTRFDYLDAS